MDMLKFGKVAGSHYGPGAFLNGWLCMPLMIPLQLNDPSMAHHRRKERYTLDIQFCISIIGFRAEIDYEELKTPGPQRGTRSIN